jgi:hypothetical protein
MNAKPLIPLIAAMFFSLSAHAHDCSGGTNGGMDATGNECNDTATVTTVVSSKSATFPSASLPKAETNQAASSNKSMIKPTAASARPRIKRS